MERKDVPEWILALEEEDVEFIKNFTLKSGSLKEIAKSYQVSYPTVRVRLDRLIQKIQLIDELENETFVHFIKQLAIDDQISLENAKLIIEKYKKSGVFINEYYIYTTDRICNTGNSIFFIDQKSYFLGSYTPNSLYHFSRCIIHS